MTQKSAPLDDYVQQISEAEHELAKLLNNPDESRGTVHTPREIAQQPFLWRETAHHLAQQAPELRLFLESAGLYSTDNRTQLMFAGAGSSDYVGLSIADLLRIRLKTASTNWPTTRLTVAPETFFLPQQEYLLVHFSRSGNSPESTAAFNWALEHRRDTVRQLVITCNRDGKLAALARRHSRHAYLIVLPEATHDEGLAMTSSFTSMVVAGQALGYLDRMEEFTNLIDRVASTAEHIVYRFTNAIADLAREPIARAFYLGNNDLLGAATEAALKIQELTAGEITARGEDTMAFRHGPISAVDSDTLIGFFLSVDPAIRRYEIDLIEQFLDAFRTMGARMLTIGPAPRGIRSAEDILSIGYGEVELPPYFQSGPAVLVGQLLALFAAYDRSYHVDDPSRDKALYSRTVQGVKLYDSRGED
jgi:tagatose-6-phosphate ketose/aldose isomerase